MLYRAARTALGRVQRREQALTGASDSGAHTVVDVDANHHTIMRGAAAKWIARDLGMRLGCREAVP